MRTYNYRKAVPIIAVLVLASIFYLLEIEHTLASSMRSYTIRSSTADTSTSGIDFNENDADSSIMSSRIGAVVQPATTNAKQEVLVVQEQMPPVQKQGVLIQTLTDIDSSTGKSFEGLKFRTFDTTNKKMKQAEENDPNDISLLLSPSFANKCSKWGVVTTINVPTLAIKHVVDMPSWCLVIVADTKTPTDYMQALKELYINDNNITDGGQQPVVELEDNVFFFSVEKQKEWEQKPGMLGSFVSSTPWKHFCRKNLGYLFAILHGANFIFDFDDDNYVKLDASGKPMDVLPLEEEEDEMKLLNVTIVANGPSYFNHHPIMHPSFFNETEQTSWARGFPLQYTQDKHTQGRVAFQTDLPFKSKIDEIGVIQYLADDNPDIDAFHRLTKPLPMSFKFDNDAHSILVPKHSYAPYNGQATVHMKNALWATLLPATVPGRVSDIWRSYFAQCIFADAGLRLVFSPPKISQQRNDHDILGDLNAEHDLYMKSGKLIDFLSGWEPQGEGGYDLIPARMEQLWIDLYERGYIEIEDVTAAQMWLGTLVQIGYEFPPLKRRFRNVAIMGQFNNAHFADVFDMVIFWAQKHREYFQTVVAAGPFSEEQLKELEANSIQAIASSVQDSSRGPIENLMNTLLLFRNSSEIEGVLYAHDDLLLNVTDLSQGLYPFPTNSIIANTLLMSKNFQTYADVRIAEDKKEANEMSYKQFPNGTFTDLNRTVFVNSLRDLGVAIPNFLHGWQGMEQKFCIRPKLNMIRDPDMVKYQEEDGSHLFPAYVQADFLFVPTKYSDEFAEAARLHIKYHVFLECAMPKIVDMVVQQTSAEVPRLVRLCTWWGGKRGKPDMYTKCLGKGVIGVMHPIKLSTGLGIYDNAMNLIQFPI